MGTVAVFRGAAARSAPASRLPITVTKMRVRLPLTQVVLVNLLLVVGTGLVLILAGGGNAPGRDRSAAIAVLGIGGALLGNWLLLRRLIERLQHERHEAGRAVLEAQERERRRLAQDLHDEVNQALTAVSLRLQASISQAPVDLQDELIDTKELVSQAMRELLALARQLRPSVLDDHGLVPALRTQVREFGETAGLDATLTITGEPGQLTPERELAVYRICQESLSNVSQHAEAQRVQITLDLDQPVHLRIADDGRGFRAAALSGDTLGLSGMRERALLAGGRLQIDSRPGAGTTVELVLD